MPSQEYHIVFESEGRIIDADVEAFYSKDGFDSFNFAEVIITDPKTNQSMWYDYMPEEFVSDAEYAAEGSLPTD